MPFREFSTHVAIVRYPCCVAYPGGADPPRRGGHRQDSGDASSRGIFKVAAYCTTGALIVAAVTFSLTFIKSAGTDEARGGAVPGATNPSSTSPTTDPAPSLPSDPTPANMVDGSTTSIDPAAVYREGDLMFQRETYPTDFDAPPTDPQWGRNSPTAWPGDDDLGTLASSEVGIHAFLGAQLASPQDGPLSYSGCTGANFSGASVPLTGLPPGEIICIRTSKDRYAGMQLLSTENQKYTFHVVTWKSGVGY